MDARFHSYLLRELRWELEQQEVTSPELTEASLEEAVVLSNSGYTSVRIQVQSAVFDIGLSWRKDIPPTIKRVAEEAV